MQLTVSPRRSPPTGKRTHVVASSQGTYERCFQIIDDMRYDRKHYVNACSFYQPPDTRIFNDYSTVIVVKHIDLDQVHANMKSGRYRTPQEFADAVRLVFANAYRYLQLGKYRDSDYATQVLASAKTLHLNEFEPRYARAVYDAQTPFDLPSDSEHLAIANNPTKQLAKVTASANLPIGDSAAGIRDPAAGSYQKCLDIIDDLLHDKKLHANAWLFFRPLDTKLLCLGDYHAIVTRDTDLTKVYDSMKSGRYRTPHEFADGVRRVFANAYRYAQLGQAKGSHWSEKLLSMAKSLQLNEFEPRFARAIFDEHEPFVLAEML